ncbi:restriction endonuclease subunit S [Bacteroides fragilis]|uniref:restriction endonuclease subunit S n=1 Tax=Bacteroides fragilis TaxID=817 RepID=UPI00321ADF82
MRFPEFSGEWKKYFIRDIAEVTKGAGISKEQRSLFGTPCILYGELYTTYKSEVINDVQSKTDIDAKNLVRSKENDVIIPSSGETAIDISTARCVPYDDVLLGGDLNIIRLYQNDGRFLSYQLNGVRKLDIARVAQGSSVIHLYGESIKSLSVSLPALKEQQKIVSLLSLIDERIATQNKIIEEYKKLKNALAESLYYPKKSQELLKLKGLNSKWEQCFLKDVVENFCRRNKSHIQYPMYSVTNDLGFVPQSEKFEERTMMGEDISSYKVINKGDFAYNPARINVGSIAKYEGDNPCMISSLYVCFRPKYNISSEWLQHLLKSQRMIYNYNLFGEGGVRIYLFFPNFGRIKISIPPLEEQKKIAAVISTIEQKISVENFILDKLNTQKSFLLTKMFI